MASPKKRRSLNPKEAIGLLDQISALAEQTDDNSAKKVLLEAGCEIADLVLKQEELAVAA